MHNRPSMKREHVNVLNTGAEEWRLFPLFLHSAEDTAALQELLELDYGDNVVHSALKGVINLKVNVSPTSIRSDTFFFF